MVVDFEGAMAKLTNFDASGIGFNFFQTSDSDISSSPTLISQVQLATNRYLFTYRLADGLTAKALVSSQLGEAYVEAISYYKDAAKIVEYSDIFMSTKEFAAAEKPKGLLEFNDVIQGNKYADKMSGYSGDDVLYGNAGRDLLKGDSGDDSLIGGEGDDTLYGGPGRDKLSGGLGKDLMYGDVGRDTFAFSKPNESHVGLDHDEIVGFDHAHDMISLSAMDADTTTRGNGTFAFSGTRSALHSVWYVENERGIIVCGDVDGVRGADFQIFLSGATHLSKADFIL